jgi:hypothetical protein
MRNRKAILVAGLALAVLDIGRHVDRIPGKTALVVTTTPIPLANGANIRVADIASNGPTATGRP